MLKFMLSRKYFNYVLTSMCLLLMVVILSTSWIFKRHQLKTPVVNKRFSEMDQKISHNGGNVQTTESQTSTCKQMGLKHQLLSNKAHPSNGSYLRSKINITNEISLQQTICDLSNCNSSQKTERWRMFTFVKSAVANIVRRQAIRRAWASLKYLDGARFETVFLVGRTDNKFHQALVEEEKTRFEDILQLDTPDDYINVPLKTLAGMQWAAENLDDEVFYTSCDDDMVVNVGGVYQEINRYLSKVKDENWPEFPIICTYSKGTRMVPIRYTEHKNYISEKLYKWPTWPEFCLGGTYTTSVSVIRQLYEISRTVKPILNTDDVWITGIIRSILGLPNSMLISPEPSLSIHFKGFYLPGIKEIHESVKSKWSEFYNKIDSSCVCAC